MSVPEIKVLPDISAIAAEAAQRFIATAAEAISARGTFSIALSGGNTPKALYELLASEPFRSRIDWPNVEFYFGDERTVPPDHPDSNYRMASESLLSKVPIAPDRIHRMRGEIDPNQAAIEYGQLLKTKFADGGLDLILLGMGDDGHTASLFPGTEALKETKHRCVANFVPKLSTWRITMSAPFINRAAHVVILVSGAAKAARLQQVLDGPKDPNRLPIQLISPASGTLTWLIDTAAGMNES